MDLVKEIKLFIIKVYCFIQYKINIGIKIVNLNHLYLFIRIFSCKLVSGDNFFRRVGRYLDVSRRDTIQRKFIEIQINKNIIQYIFTKNIINCESEFACLFHVKTIETNMIYFSIEIVLCVCIRVYVCMFVRPSVCLFVCLSVSRSVCSLVCMVCSFVCLFVSMSVCFFVCVCMYVRLSVCLPVVSNCLLQLFDLLFNAISSIQLLEHICDLHDRQPQILVRDLPVQRQPKSLRIELQTFDDDAFVLWGFTVALVPNEQILFTGLSKVTVKWREDVCCMDSKVQATLSLRELRWR